MGIKKSDQFKQSNKWAIQPTYSVGFGKPPEETRFQPGKSGNPKGRPRGKRNGKATLSISIEHERLKSIILEEAYRTIKVNEGEGQIIVPMATAVMRSVAVAAAKGNTRAQKIFSDLLSKTEAANKQRDDEYMEIMITYKSEWEMELERRKRQNITALPDPLPHPDDIIVDFRRNTVHIHGPMDKREQDKLDEYIRCHHEIKAEIKMGQEELEDPEYADVHAFIKNENAHKKHMLELAEQALASRASPECIARRQKALNLKTPEYLLRLKALEALEALEAQARQN